MTRTRGLAIVNFTLNITFLGGIQAMKSVSMVEFRHHAQEVVERVRRGQRLVLTYRGKAMARIEPIDAKATEDDPFYALAKLADAEGETLSNREMDEAVYGL